MGAIGAILDLWEAEEGQYSRGHRQFGIGDKYYHDDGSCWVYCEANGAITGDGYVVAVDENYNATQLTTAVSAFGDRVGVCHSAQAVTDGQRGWVQIYGATTVRVAASVGANTQLLTTTTAGVLGATTGAGARNIASMVLGVAQGGTAGLNVSGFLNWPDQGAAT